MTASQTNLQDTNLQDTNLHETNLHETNLHETWTTRLEGTGDIEIHTAWFVPLGWPGHGPTISLGLPECEMIMTMPMVSGNDTCSILNQPPPMDRKPKVWVAAACREAMGTGAVLIINGNTASELQAVVPQALAALKGYKRMPLERFYHAADRADRPLP